MAAILSETVELVLAMRSAGMCLVAMITSLHWASHLTRLDWLGSRWALRRCSSPLLLNRASKLSGQTVPTKVQTVFSVSRYSTLDCHQYSYPAACCGAGCCPVIASGKLRLLMPPQPFLYTNRRSTSFTANRIAR